MISRAMEVTAHEYGTYKVDYARQNISFERKQELMSAGEFANVERVSGDANQKVASYGLTRVDFPLMRGVMGFRILLIRAEDQARFDKVKQFDQLTKFTMGFGKGWEGSIYKFNGLHVTETVTFSVLLNMLAGHRYDFVPLGMCEIEDTYRVGEKTIRDLVPEKNLLLAYYAPTYFYVSPKDKDLAARLKKGLDILEKNGEADKIFDEFFAARLKALNVKNRLVFQLNSPDFSEGQQPVDVSILKNY